MALPVSRQEFKDKILRNLGVPLHCINVTEEQLDDKVDDALQYYRDYHFDGTERVFYPHRVTNTDKTNKYIDLPNSLGISGITRIFPLTSSTGVATLFNIRYQIHLNDMFDTSASSLTPYVMAMTHIRLLEEIFVGLKPIRYNRHANRLHIDMDWNQVEAGEFVLIDMYQTIDPDVYTDVWGDRWLIRYATQLTKKQWGENMKKFGNVQLPGGTELNGKEIYDEADQALEKMETEMLESFSLPTYDMIG
jgi:hypothetical protein